MSAREWSNPFVGYTEDNKVLTVDDMKVLLSDMETEHPTYLGRVVCSREYYERPALTPDPVGTRESTLNDLRLALELGGQGWRGGSYRFYPESKMLLTSAWGRLGVPLSVSVLAAYWMGMDEALRRSRR